MKPNTLLPTAFLVTALLGAGAAVATAQSQSPVQEPAAATAQAAPADAPAADERGPRMHRGGDEDRRGAGTMAAAPGMAGRMAA
ncbi:MAG: hypothetical protein ACU0B9_15395 [Limimaricola soesokkakensis]|uniref:hypothetical protein n=1 Tax=Limimaricola soesokkakensis TaxID=1343159 RepID=UPI004058EA16